MTLFDLIVIATILISTLLALSRGLVREVIALVAWIVALVLGLSFAGPLAGQFGNWKVNPAVLQVIAFIVIFFAVLIAGGVIAALLSGVIRTIGLGWLDRLLGGGFGEVRGVLLVLFGILLAGLTSIPRSDWWQNSALAAPLTAAALELKDWLPSAWAERLDFSPGRPASREGGTRVALPAQRET
jgi:membrane protein required for colicin V production